jgi:hypothetical protein
MHKFLYQVSFIVLIITVISCCDPKPRNSYPTVIDSSYSYLAIKDAFPTGASSIDSFYYPVYTLDIKNTGSQADSFTLIIDPQVGYYPLTVSQFVAPGETKTFKTYGPLPSNVLDSAKYRYYGFRFYDPDSLNLRIFRPRVTVSYGGTIDGPESCGSPAIEKVINIDSLGIK